MLINIFVALVIFWSGFFVGYIRWDSRDCGGTIMLGEEDGEPRINLVIFEKYANNLESYDSINLRVEKYSTDNMK